METDQMKCNSIMHNVNKSQMITLFVNDFTKRSPFANPSLEKHRKNVNTMTKTQSNMA